MEKTIQEIKKIFTDKGEEAYYGEKVSQFEHGAQCLLVALSEDQAIDMQVAAFLHDIGHMIDEPGLEGQDMDGFGNKDHELIARKWLQERGFSEKIQTVVYNHVEAKRYLCYADKNYYESLSDASKKTLEFQGGVMTENEAIAFREAPYFEESLLLRKWDDLGKIPNTPLPKLEDILEIIRQYLRTTL
jgi:predicted HD phosphohydrolase